MDNIFIWKFYIYSPSQIKFILCISYLNLIIVPILHTKLK